MTDKQPLTYPCPQCRKDTSLTHNVYRPFCSERCRLIDLGAWASESYKVGSNESANASSETDLNDFRLNY